MLAKTSTMHRIQSDSSTIGLESSDDIPSMIFVPGEKTYISRWDSGVNNNGQDSDRSLDLKDAMAMESSIRSTYSTGNACGKPDCSAQPLKTPTRTTFDSPIVAPTESHRRMGARSAKVRKQLAASVKTGIDIGSIRLSPVAFPSDLDDDDDDNAMSASQKQPVALASAATLSDILLSRRRPTSGNPHPTNPTATGDAGGELTAVFCIRRPGCGSCRDHGMQLAQLTKELAKGPHGIKVNLFGITKETSNGGKAKNDALLSDFYSNYFPYPLYQDKDWNAFKFLGSRDVSVWKLLQSFPKMEHRYKTKQIENVPFGGDIFTQGGVLLFDKDGQLKYVYYERYGDELDIPALRWAIQDVAAASSSRSTGATVTGAGAAGTPTHSTSKWITKRDEEQRRRPPATSRVDNTLGASSRSFVSAPLRPTRRRSFSHTATFHSSAPSNLNETLPPRKPMRCADSECDDGGESIWC